MARKYWEENRDIQDTFFGQMSDLSKGFKELVLNKLRKHGFLVDIKKYARLSTELNKSASIKVLNFNIYNALTYNIVFGVVVFVFPMIIASIYINELREILFIVFYMIGPFGTIAGSIPQITSMRVNLNRINVFVKDLDEYAIKSKSSCKNLNLLVTNDVNIRFTNVKYTYMVQEKENVKADEFILGPLSLDFKTGELTFITGGNGSGKSTLAKLIAGLYSPEEGSITVNGELIGMEFLNDCFTSIFSDFHLFRKLYGINYDNKKEEMEALLSKMKIKNNIMVNSDGVFNSLDLSTGQKKRLAFIICCLEDKPMMLFDEWAAEQDPEFRHYFYNDLLPMLKSQGKGVIVVTHDDRYFNIADRVIKLERGALVEYKEKVYA